MLFSQNRYVVIFKAVVTYKMSCNLFYNNLHIWKNVGSERKRGLWKSRKDKSISIRLKRYSFGCGSEREGYSLLNARNWGPVIWNVLVEAMRPQTGKVLKGITEYSNRGIAHSASHMITIAQVTPCGVNRSPKPDR